jgi:DNA-directed RNA polymerase subunit RPC12/RpoP
MIEIVVSRALRCRMCGSDWKGSRCAYCGHDRFVDVTGYYPAGPGSLGAEAWMRTAVRAAELEQAQNS